MLNLFLSHPTWWAVRFSAIFISPGIIFDFEIMFLLQSLVLLHAKIGLESIMNDYVHDTTVKLLYLFFLRILSLEILLYFIDFIL